MDSGDAVSIAKEPPRKKRKSTASTVLSNLHPDLQTSTSNAISQNASQAIDQFQTDERPHESNGSDHPRRRAAIAVRVPHESQE